MQDGERGFVVADQHGLGDFEFEPVRRQTRDSKRAGDLQRQCRAFQLHRRDVDREPHVGRPAGRLGARGTKHPLPKFNDQAGLLRDRDEFRR